MIGMKKYNNYYKVYCWNWKVLKKLLYIFEVNECDISLGILFKFNI